MFSFFKSRESIKARKFKNFLETFAKYTADNHGYPRTRHKKGKPFRSSDDNNIQLEFNDSKEKATFIFMAEDKSYSIGLTFNYDGNFMSSNVRSNNDNSLAEDKLQELRTTLNREIRDWIK